MATIRLLRSIIEGEFYRDTADKSQSSRHIPCAVHLELQQISESLRLSKSERHDGARLLPLSVCVPGFVICEDYFNRLRFLRGTSCRRKEDSLDYSPLRQDHALHFARFCTGLKTCSTLLHELRCHINLAVTSTSLWTSTSQWTSQ
jgi:hypothetical protein